MFPAPFEYHRAASVDEALALPALAIDDCGTVINSLTREKVRRAFRDAKSTLSA